MEKLFSKFEQGLGKAGFLLWKIFPRGYYSLKRLMLRCGCYDFIDFGSKAGKSIESAKRRWGVRRALGIQISPKMVKNMRQLGYSCIQADVTKIALPGRCVSFVTIVHMLEHLSDRRAAKLAIQNAVHSARDFIYIRGPYFDADDYLKDRGLKFFWSDWVAHPYHLTTQELTGILLELELKNFQFEYPDEILDSAYPAFHPLNSPPNQRDYDAQIHPPKPFVKFERPVYRQMACQIWLK
jgi:hypothetical protein